MLYWMDVSQNVSFVAHPFCLMKTPGCAGEFKKALAFHMKKKLLLIQ